MDFLSYHQKLFDMCALHTPINENVWRALASIYRDRGDYVKALDAEERAIELELKSNANKQ